MQYCTTGCTSGATCTQNPPVEQEEEEEGEEEEEKEAVRIGEWEPQAQGQQR